MQSVDHGSQPAIDQLTTIGAIGKHECNSTFEILYNRTHVYRVA